MKQLAREIEVLSRETARQSDALPLLEGEVHWLYILSYKRAALLYIDAGGGIGAALTLTLTLTLP